MVNIRCPIRLTSCPGLCQFSLLQIPAQWSCAALLLLNCVYYQLASWRAWSCYSAAGRSHCWLGRGVYLWVDLLSGLHFLFSEGKGEQCCFLSESETKDSSCQLVKAYPHSRFCTFYRPLTLAWPAIVSQHSHMHGPMRTLHHSCEGGRAADHAHMSGMRNVKLSHESLWSPR